MSTPVPYVHIVDDVPELMSRGDQDLPLLMVLDGFLDAGNSAQLAAKHLTGEHLDEASAGPVVATFDVDAFHDYRARRPAVTFARDHYEDYDAPRLVVRLLRDAAGQPFLLLTGPEPDHQWERFASAVRAVVERFGVTVTISLGAVPMAVPHTRDLQITQHANRRELIHHRNEWRSELRVPASAQSLVEIRLGEAGLPMTGFVAHVPHYLAQSDHPLAASSLLSHVETATGLALDLDSFETSIVERAQEIAQHLDENPEAAAVVAGLEEQYDAFLRSEAEGRDLLAPDQPLPTGDEIGAEFEQFLAGLDDTDPLQ